MSGNVYKACRHPTLPAQPLPQVCQRHLPGEAGVLEGYNSFFCGPFSSQPIFKVQASSLIQIQVSNIHPVVVVDEVFRSFT